MEIDYGTREDAHGVEGAAWVSGNRVERSRDFNESTLGPTPNRPLR